MVFHRACCCPYALVQVSVCWRAWNKTAPSGVCPGAFDSADVCVFPKERAVASAGSPSHNDPDSGIRTDESGSPGKAPSVGENAAECVSGSGSEECSSEGDARGGSGGSGRGGRGGGGERFVGLPPLLPHRPFQRHDPGVSPEVGAKQFHGIMARRRTVRMYSDRAVSRETIEWCVRAAGTAPSGAHKQPWRFVCVSDPQLKREIRLAAETEEREFYEHRASRRWLEDLSPLGTDPRKPFLEIAPWLIIVFQLTRTDDGGQVYYREESVGLACGLLLAACHHAGLVTLTHTPSPMKFLTRLLRRPANERPFLLIPVGYPAGDCEVPDMERKPLDEIMVVNRPDAEPDGEQDTAPTSS